MRVGGFTLESVLGRGGMGAVWRAVHVASGTPVAIKVLTSERAREERCRLEFRQEVRAVAALDHPGVVPVLDLGEIPEDAAAASGGELVAGSPWLAMELGALGSLDRVPGPLRWGRVRRVLASLLDALSHAHARGLVHRDLKPANLMLGGAGEWNGTVRLVDFGLASMGERRTSGFTEDSVAGTPLYMAPEQFKGHWRDYGAWTDLYAVGCIAHQLATGRFAFQADTVFALAWAHTLGPRPELPRGLSLPPGFDAWVARLLAVEPADRFRLAADAAWELSELEGDTDLEAAPTLHALDPAGFHSATVRMDGTLPGLDGATARVETIEDRLEPGAVPPIPPTWRNPRPPKPSRPLRGVGLGLFGLRAIPLVGRLRTRELLWQALRNVRSTGRPRLILLHGPAGTGKSTLARWLAERGAEVGTSTTLQVEHGSLPHPRHGLEAALARRLTSGGLEGDEVRQRLEALPELTHLPAWAGRGLTRLLDGSGSPDRASVIGRVAAELAADRPLVVVLEDLHWGPATVDALPRLLDQDAPLLLLATVRDEELAGQDPMTDAIDALLRRDRVSQVEVPALPPAEQLELVRELLGFDTGLAARLAERTAGNPLFARQVVGDWVRRGLLVVGEEGFQVRPGAEIRLPPDLQETWEHRLEERFADAPADALASLELAAALGNSVDLGEWAQACMEGGVGGIALGSVVEALLAERLAVPTESGWAFAHGMLREALVRRARRRGTWVAWNRAAARAIGDDPAEAEGLERLGRHRLEADEVLASLDPLLAAAEAWQARGVPRRALALLDLRGQAIPRSGLPEQDERHGLGPALRARIHRFRGELDEALRWARRTERGAGEWGWPRAGALARLRVAQVAHLRGDLETSLRLHTAALAQLQALELRQPAAEAEQALADLALRRGDLLAADAGFEQAAASFALAGDAAGTGNCLRARALVARRRQDRAAATSWIALAMEHYAEAGHLSGRADCLNTMAELDREAGKLAAAQAGYEQAVELQDAVGAEAAGIFPRVNLALVLLAQQRWADASVPLEHCRSRLEGAGRQGVLGCVWTFQANAEAGLGQWADAGASLDRAQALLDEAGVAEEDVAWSAAVAAELAIAAGRTELAARCLDVAAEQWRRLGRSEPLDEVRRRRASLA